MVFCYKFWREKKSLIHPEVSLKDMHFLSKNQQGSELFFSCWVALATLSRVNELMYISIRALYPDPLKRVSFPISETSILRSFHWALKSCSESTPALLYFGIVLTIPGPLYIHICLICKLMIAPEHLEHQSHVTPSSNWLQLPSQENLAISVQPSHLAFMSHDGYQDQSIWTECWKYWSQRW